MAKSKNSAAAKVVDNNTGKNQKAKAIAPKSTKSRSKRYREARKLVSKDKLYLAEEAIELVKKTSVSRFIGNLEAHLVVRQKGDLGEVKLPYSKGKEKRIVIADDKIIAAIKKGQIDFDILLASPKIMPKLLPLARILGPKGLMPNPKNGTLSENPEAAREKFAAAGLRLKTEKKAPVLHLVLGKLNQKTSQLKANLKAVIKAVGFANIEKIVLAATMGPGIKVDPKQFQE